MRRAEIARELRKLADSGMLRGDTFLTETCVSFPELMAEAAVLLEDDSKLHEACDLLESLKEFPERMRLERDARRYRVLKSAVNRLFNHPKAWIIDLIKTDSEPELVKTFVPVTRKIEEHECFDTLDAALDAWIKDHG